LSSAAKSAASSLTGQGGLLGSLGKVASAAGKTLGPIGGMLGLLEGMSRLVGAGSFFEGIAEGFGDIAETIDEGIPGRGGGRQGGGQGSGTVSTGSVAEALTNLPGDVTPNEARGIVGQFRSRVQGGASNRSLANLLSSVSSASLGHLANHYQMREAINRVTRGAAAFNMGGIVTQDTLAQLHGSPSRPEAVIPLDRLPGLMERMGIGGGGGNGKQVINIMLDRDVLARHVIEGMPGRLDLMNLR
jgi:hypothetical protein